MKERETFASRLGFVLISAGCAIGLGNVWRFPYIVGQYGGAAFVLIYLLFLVIMGLPIMSQTRKILKDINDLWGSYECGLPTSRPHILGEFDLSDRDDFM